MPLAQPPLLNRITKDRHEFIKGIRRGHIFQVDLQKKHAVGTEQYHDGKPTPFVVVSRGEIHSNLALVQAVPLSLYKQDDHRLNGPARNFRIRIPASLITFYQAHTAYELKEADVIALTEQLRVLGHERLLENPVGFMSPSALGSIEAGVRYVLDIPAGLAIPQ
jgi:mRNA-degrading endonuclease toxin of MazEF toxin-antitoxin module